MLRGNQNTCLLFLLILLVLSCSSEIREDAPIESRTNISLEDQKYESTASEPEIKVGAESISEYLPMLKNKRVAIVGNQTSVIGSTFLVDTLLSLGIDVTLLFAPEHGFRGNHDAGEKVKHSQVYKNWLVIRGLSL